jgi:hypothetical protein
MEPSTPPPPRSGIRRIYNRIDVQSRDVSVDGADSTGHLSPNGQLPGEAGLEHRLPARMVISESDVIVVMRDPDGTPRSFRLPRQYVD